jgi:hypothetical protein
MSNEGISTSSESDCKGVAGFWFVWLERFIWFVSFNQINEINQTNQSNRRVFPLHTLAISTCSSARLSGVSKLVRPSVPSR